MNIPLYQDMVEISDLACTRLADPHSGPASLPLALHLHPGPPFLIKLGSDEVFLRCAVLLSHSPVKYVISNSRNQKIRKFSKYGFYQPITEGKVDKSLQTKKEVFVLIF